MAKVESGGAQFTSAEYLRFKQNVLENKKRFKKVLSLRLSYKTALDIKELIKKCVDAFYKKDIDIEVTDERQRLINNEPREFVLTIQPLVKVIVWGRIVNYHYVVIKEEIKDKKPFVAVDFYLNTMRSDEVEKMDKVLSKLAKFFEDRGITIVEEKLVRFKPKKK